MECDSRTLTISLIVAERKCIYDKCCNAPSQAWQQSHGGVQREYSSAQRKFSHLQRSYDAGPLLFVSLFIQFVNV